MFLIQYRDGEFVEASTVEMVDLKIEGKDICVYFHTNKGRFSVGRRLQCSFLNHLQAVNDNIDSLEAYYRKLEDELRGR